MDKVLKIILQIIVPFLFIFVAYIMVKSWIANKPPKVSREIEKIIPSLKVISVRPGEHAPPVKSFGTVQAQYETVLRAQVTGRIIELSPKFKVGEKLSKGEVLVKIDDTDFQAAKAQAEFNLSQARFRLAEEEVLASQAEDDWKAAGRKLEDASEYLLRKPQLTAAKESVKANEKALEKAQVDIDRTQILVPFDALVTQRSASLGNLASASDTLGTIISTERFEVRLPLTRQQFKRMSALGDAGIPIKLTSPLKPDLSWKGTLVRMDPTIDLSNQTIHAIAEIVDPYKIGTTLPVGSFINAEIPAKAFEAAFEIPNNAIVNDAFIWMVSKKDEGFFISRLKVDRLHSFAGMAYVNLERPVELPLKLLARPLANHSEGDEIHPEGDPPATDLDK